MIILFEENATEFTTLGLGILKDATKCMVSESLNDTFELGLEYPITGLNYDKIKINRIIYTKVDPYNEAQPFRIIGITRPIKGIVTVTAVHISYDMNGLPVKPIDGQNLLDTLSKIQNGTLIEHNFNFISQVSSGRTYKTTAPYNMRAIFMGGEESVLTKYNLEVKFDKYNVLLYSKRGADRGAQVKYAHNMIDISHVSKVDNLYNGVFPYYHSEQSSTETDIEEGFTQAYIVGSKPFQSGWLSYTKDGEPFIPLDESPIQIATEGDYYQKVYVWNELYQNFVEKIYNEQIMVVQGILEPTWITIDWSKFPTIICRANRKGYFKKGTDTDWGDIKGVGDIIFEGSIVSSGMMENLIIYFSEVIPTNADKENTEVTEIIDVQLDDPIIWIDTFEAKQMLHNNILCLDLTSEFEDEPSKERLKAKAEEYINENKLGAIKHTTTVSFIDLAATTDADKYQNFEHIELGDTVRVIYEDLGVNVDLRVIKVDYDVLNDRYDKIELGEKDEKLSSSSVQTGDNVSALTNDAGYASVTTVHKLIAETITANYIEGVNAKLSSAQIKQLEVERINATGIIEASQFSLDTVIAKMLIAENAQIAQTLTAGQLKIAGDVEIYSGRIRIEDENSNTSFVVDRNGNLTANSVSITGGFLNINDGVFEVTNEGVLTASSANISGTIMAKDGIIGGFVIDESKLYNGDIGGYNSVYISPNANIPASIAGSPVLSNWAFTAGTDFGVTNDGTAYVKDIRVQGGNTIFDIIGSDGSVTIEDGKLTAVDGDFAGTITAENGYIATFEISGTSIKIGQIGYQNSVFLSTGYSTSMSIGGSGWYNREWCITVDDAFGVTKTGEVYANAVHLTGEVTATSGKIAALSIDQDELVYTDAFSNKVVSINPTVIENIFLENYTLYARSARFGTLYSQHQMDSYGDGAYLTVLGENGLTSIYKARASVLSNSYRSNISIRDLSKIPIVTTYNYSQKQDPMEATICPRIYANRLSPSSGYVVESAWGAPIGSSVHGMTHTILSAVATISVQSGETHAMTFDHGIYVKIYGTDVLLYYKKSSSYSPEDVNVIIVGY